MHHLDYLKRKSQLEVDDTNRWELFDWNVDREIAAFGNRLGIDIPINSNIYYSIRSGSDENSGNLSIIEDVIKKYLSRTTCGNERSINEITFHIVNQDRISDTARSLGFVDLLQRTNITNDEIANLFITVSYLNHGPVYLKFSSICRFCRILSQMNLKKLY